jgi:hypothetical protein
LNDGHFYRSGEVDTGYATRLHVLGAIADETHRHESAAVFLGILSGCIGISDVKEYEIEKPKDSTLEKRWSGQKSKVIRCLVCWITMVVQIGFIIHYNPAFHELRQGVEDSYGRVGMWFPILGNNNN